MSELTDLCVKASVTFGFMQRRIFNFTAVRITNANTYSDEGCIIRHYRQHHGPWTRIVLAASKQTRNIRHYHICCCTSWQGRKADPRPQNDTERRQPSRRINSKDTRPPAHSTGVQISQSAVRSAGSDYVCDASVTSFTIYSNTSLRATDSSNAPQNRAPSPTISWRT